MKFSRDVSGADEIPPKVLSDALSYCLGGCSFTISDCAVSNFEPRGHSGNRLYRVFLDYEAGSRQCSASFIAKRWEHRTHTALFSRSEHSRDVLMWQRGYLKPSSLPEGVAVPYVYASDEEGNSWIVMNDVSKETTEYAADWDSEENVKAVLASLAAYHGKWIGLHQVDDVDRAWLYGQGDRIDFFRMNFEAWLKPGNASAEYRELWRIIDSRNPGSEERAKNAFMDFLRLLPHESREIWETHMTDRSGLRQGLDGLAVTLLHGDVGAGNMGIRRNPSAAEVVLIDWERAGIGVPAIDVAALLFTTYLLPHAGFPPILSQHPIAESRSALPVALVDALQRYYFEQLKKCAAVAVSDGDWERSWTYSLLVYGVSMLPILLGYVRGNPSREAGALGLIEYSSRLMRDALR